MSRLTNYSHEPTIIIIITIITMIIKIMNGNQINVLDIKYKL